MQTHAISLLPELVLAASPHTAPSGVWHTAGAEKQMLVPSSSSVPVGCEGAEM